MPYTYEAPEPSNVVKPRFEPLAFAGKVAEPERSRPTELANSQHSTGVSASASAAGPLSVMVAEASGGDQLVHSILREFVFDIAWYRERVIKVDPKRLGRCLVENRDGTIIGAEKAAATDRESADLGFFLRLNAENVEVEKSCA